tara:strand:+ start:611 stop:1063 length:453 start_codon:yes stop_codon:yes gene_type:complete
MNKKDEINNEINNEINDNTTFINNFNPINYYSFWSLTWYILYKFKFINSSPLCIFFIIFIPSTYLLLMYIKYSKDNTIMYIFKIIMSSIAHYLPIIDLLRNKNLTLEKILNLEIILLNLILINLYFTYLNHKDLDINKIYYDYYLNNKLI